jgi:hypothetical protein
MVKVRRIWVVVAAVLVALAIVPGALAWTLPWPEPQVVYVPGNPTCQDLGYEQGYKIEPVLSGEYWIPDMGPSAKITLQVRDEVYVNWRTIFGTDIVIVKGGPNANAYISDEMHAGVRFSAPINPNTGRPYGLSHIQFCWDGPPPCVPGNTVCP